jgi:YegS/Rv2252/BmrU family lipid kinase
MDESRGDKLFVLFNPQAGSAAGQEEVGRRLADQLTGEGWEVTLYETRAQEPLQAIVREAIAGGSRLIVAAGGDGTVTAAIDGIALSSVPLAIIPLGTGNGLARALELPLDLDTAVKLISGRQRRLPIDLMQVGDHYYVLNVATGVTTHALRNVRQELKQRLGRAAYPAMILSELLDFRTPRCTVEVDGRVIYPRASQILIANGLRLDDGELEWGPQSRFHDGQLDLYIIRAQSLLEYARLGWDLLRRRQHENPHISHLAARHRIRITTRKQQPVEADGELIGHTPVDVTLRPAAAQVIVPPLNDEAT